MKKTQSSRGLHLVQATELSATSQPEPEPSTPSQLEIDRLVGQGVLRYEALRVEVDRALFATPQDIETLEELMPQMQLLRERLASYGVHVRV